jgi:hypothetical protein
MLDIKEAYWKVREYTDEAKGIAWDTCHKVYILMDDEQVALMRSYGYGNENDPDSLITSDQLDPAEMATVAATWFDKACGLRFIQAVRSNPTDPNEGFIDIISQFEGNEDEDEEDEDD